MTVNIRTAICVSLLLVLAGCGFASFQESSYDPPGFFMGIWHGLIAPWTLILRLFVDIKMYAYPNTGWFYDFGFVIGAIFSIPVGWIAALIALVVHIL